MLRCLPENLKKWKKKYFEGILPEYWKKCFEGVVFRKILRLKHIEGTTYQISISKWHLNFASVVTVFTSNSHIWHCFFGKKVPNVDVDLATHGARPDFQPAVVTSDMTVPALHDGRKTDFTTDGALESLLHVVEQLTASGLIGWDSLSIPTGYKVWHSSTWTPYVLGVHLGVFAGGGGRGNGLSGQESGCVGVWVGGGVAWDQHLAPLDFTRLTRGWRLWQLHRLGLLLDRFVDSLHVDVIVVVFLADRWSLSSCAFCWRSVVFVTSLGSLVRKVGSWDEALDVPGRYKWERVLDKRLAESSTSKNKKLSLTLPSFAALSLVSTAVSELLFELSLPLRPPGSPVTKTLNPSCQEIQDFDALFLASEFFLAIFLLLKQEVARWISALKHVKFTFAVRCRCAVGLYKSSNNNCVVEQVNFWHRFTPTTYYYYYQ